MDEPSRRDFLRYLGALALLPRERTGPQTILYNGNVITVDIRQLG